MACSDALVALGNARVIDAAGRMVVPGFIDSHVHFIDGGFGLSAVQLRDGHSNAVSTGFTRDFSERLSLGATGELRREYVGDFGGGIAL